MSETYNTSKAVCPFCGEKLDAAEDCTPIHPNERRPPREPRENDIAVCMYCAEVLEFKADGTLMQARLSSLMSIGKAHHILIEKTQKWVREKRPKENEKPQTPK